MENSHALAYPTDKLKIVWVTDGSNDRTNELLKQYPEVTVLFQPQRKGKTAALNRGIQYITTPYVIFTDAKFRYANPFVSNIAFTSLSEA